MTNCRVGASPAFPGNRSGCPTAASRSSSEMKIVMLPPLCLWLVFAVSGFAQQAPQSLADAELPSLLTIYKDLHSHPELSGYEERTAALVAKELRATGCQVTEELGKYENSKPKLKGYG